MLFSLHRLIIGVLSTILLVSTRGVLVRAACEGENTLEATYNFGKFDDNFVKQIKPGSGCSLLLQGGTAAEIDNGTGPSLQEKWKNIKAFPYCVDNQPGQGQSIESSESFREFTKLQVQWGSNLMVWELPVDKNTDKLAIDGNSELFRIDAAHKGDGNREYSGTEVKASEFLEKADLKDKNSFHNPYKFAVKGKENAFVYCYKDAGNSGSSSGASFAKR